MSTTPRNYSFTDEILEQDLIKKTNVKPIKF